MADDKDKLNQHDETNEYEFHDDEAPLNYEYDETPAKGKKPKKERGPDDGSGKRKKMIVIIVVVLVVLFVVFEVMHKRSAEKNIAQQQVKQTQAKVEPKSNPKMTETNKLLTTPKPFPQESAVKKQPSASLAALTASSTEDNAALKKQVTDLKAKEQVALDKLQSQQSESQTQVMNLKSQIDDLNQQIETLTSNLNQTQGKLSTMQEKAEKEAAYRANSAKRKAAAIRKDKKYFVEAVIPGRAWLKAEDGSTVTVSVGDNLPGYGKVLSINPYDGIVTTQEGAIPYGVSGD